MNYYPPHEVKDKAKLQGMIDTIKSGGSLPPVVVYENQAYTGSHRIAAWEEVGEDVEAIEIGKNEFLAARATMNNIDDFDPNDSDDVDFLHKHFDYDVFDYNDFCEALLEITNDPAIKDAIKDQVY